MLLRVVLYGSLILREGHRLEVLKNMLCALESRGRKQREAIKICNKRKQTGLFADCYWADHVTQNFLEGACSSDGTDGELTQNCT